MAPTAPRNPATPPEHPAAPEQPASPEQPAPPLRRVLVIGGGRIGAALARRLTASEHLVTVVEPDPERARELAVLLPGVEVVAGDGTEVAVLERAGIHDVEVVAAVTGDDPCNLAVTALARHGFAVPRTIARIVDPAHAWLFHTATGVDVAVDQADLLSRLIVEEMGPDDGGPP